MPSDETTDTGAQSLKDKWAARRKEVKPKSISVSPEALVEVGFLEEGQELPLVIRPVHREVDLMAWLRAHRDYVEEQLLKYGGLLFRGFATPAQHNSAVHQSIGLTLMESLAGATPRKKSATRSTFDRVPARAFHLIHKNLLC